MAFLLTETNVFDYLIERDLCQPEDRFSGEVDPVHCKNFNLKVSWGNRPSLLVKQEGYDKARKPKTSFEYEWCLYDFLRHFSELEGCRQIVSEAIYFDRDRSILVFKFLEDYRDLEDYYRHADRFPLEIARALGSTLATVHRLTLNRQRYRLFLQRRCRNFGATPTFLKGLDEIKPEIFGEVAADGLRFYELYQRYPRLGGAIAELNAAWEPCCLIHSDLKLDNVLLHTQWQEVRNSKSQPAIRLIDWEKWQWGDPAFDVGTAIASYLKLWLSSLTVSAEIDIETALKLAGTPLELIQPSIREFYRSYCQEFPEIKRYRVDFLERVVQFAGLALIERLRARIEYLESFGNLGICMLQVAIGLLCHPKASIPSVFGVREAEQISFSHVLA